MQIGLGVDPGAGLTFPQHRDLAQAAAGLGYQSLWTPAGVGNDAFQTCGQWWTASGSSDQTRLGTGISVVPVPIWSVPALATAAATLGELTHGQFILGIGSGSIHTAGYRQTFGLPDWKPLPLMRDFLNTLRPLLAGERVDYTGPTVKLHQLSLGRRQGAQPVPVYLGALGPGMLRLAGEAADGAALNWCAPEQIAWSRERVAEGAAKADRDPAEIQIAEYIRVCVDDDEDLARKALARAVIPYAMLPPGGNKAHGYRAHFARMGFDAALTALEAKRDAGATMAELAEAFPPDLLLRVGYFGKPAGAATAFKQLAAGLDLAIVRVVPARSGLDAVLAVAHACQPSAVMAN